MPEPENELTGTCSAKADRHEMERHQVQPGKRDNLLNMVWSGAHHWWETSQCVGNVKKLAVALTALGAVTSPVFAATAAAAATPAASVK